MNSPFNEPTSSSDFSPARPDPTPGPLGGVHSPLAMEHPGLPATSARSGQNGGLAQNAETALRRAATAVSGQASRLASEIRTRTNQVADGATHMAHEVKDCVQRHPLASTLTTVGLGVAIGFALHELLRPRETTGQRAMHLLNDIRDSLSEVAARSAEHAKEYAKDATRHGSKAMKRGMEAVADSRVADQLRHLFS